MNNQFENLSENKISLNERNRKYALISSIEEYMSLYKKSIENPKEFWSKIAEQFYWKTQPSKEFYSYNFDSSKGQVFIEWLAGSKTNICYNVLDRNIENGFGDSIAYHWESNDSQIKRQISYSELLSEVCKFANVLKGLGVKKGDKIAIYMPVTIEFVVAMLSSARIGAVHVVIFAGLSSEALADRMLCANCNHLITVDGAYRCDKFINFKDICNKSIDICKQNKLIIRCCIVKQHFSNKSNGNQIVWNSGVDFLWDELIAGVNDKCEPVWLEAEDTLFILCTSGSTGKPKCIVHTIGGYMLWTYIQNKYIFNCRAGDVFFSTADLGWMIGHSHSVYGALANTSTVVLIEGSPFYPSFERILKIIARLKVNTFVTAPTTIRTLMKSGINSVTKYKMNSLRVLAFGGEPINPDAWFWFWDVIGQQKCTVINLYGQTEAGGTLITNFPGCITMKPSSTGLPFFGIIPAILDSNGNELEGEAEGYLVFKQAWPGIARTIEGSHDTFINSYFDKFPGYYWSGDAVRRDRDHYYWIYNRVDEMLKVSGHLLSSLEIENAILEHKLIAETAVVSAPDPIKGQSVHVFVVLNNSHQFSEELDKSLKQIVRNKIGGLAQPDVIHVVSALPRNKSGKIMRRILFGICKNDHKFGDISMIADETILDELKNIHH